MPAQFDAAAVRVHATQFHHWQQLQRSLEDNIHYGLLADAALAVDCDTLIYYWPKSKQEAEFQLFNLLSLLPVGCEIFVVGKTAAAYAARKICWPRSRR